MFSNSSLNIIKQFRPFSLIFKTMPHHLIGIMTSCSVYKMKTWKQEFFVKVYIYFLLQHSDTGVKATWPT